MTTSSQPHHHLWVDPLETSEPTHAARGEQALWTAVITQALMDAATHSGKQEKKRDKTHALTWIELADMDFQDVCDLAGLDPSYVTHRARRAISNGCQWRLPAGQGWRTRARTHATSGNAPHTTEVQ